MKNREVAKILSEIGEYLDMQETPFKPRAYKKAAEIIDELKEDIALVYERGGIKALGEIPGVGKSIAEKIEEYLKTGRVKYHEELKKKTPVDLSTLTQVEGLGPKKINKLYKELKIKNLGDLEKAGKAGKIRRLESFGETSEENILKGIGFLKRSGGRFVLGLVMPVVREIEKQLSRLKEVDRVIIAGSVRRKKETIGDVDILVVSEKPELVMDYFTSMPEIINIYAKGNTKSAVKISVKDGSTSYEKNELDVDLRVIPEKSFGAALNYFTGSKDHNVALRRIAMGKGYKLNEYGLFREKKQIAGKSEEEIYKALGMDYIEPELREMTGEITAAQEHKLPKLIKYSDLRCDLQVHSNWTDGTNSIIEMAEAAFMAGLEYIAITDHTKKLAMTGGLDEKGVLKQIVQIDKINSKLSAKSDSAFGGRNSGSLLTQSSRIRNKFKILKSTECDILKDGSLDLPNNILAKLDIVGVAVHSYFNLSKEDQTKRITRAMKNSYVNILFHPTGRIINKRQAYDVDMDEIIRTAKETGVILEIDAYPNRLDLRDEYIRKCVAKGVKMAIDSDAHSAAHFAYLEYGIAQARRGWAKREDIINTRPLEEMLKILKK